MLCGLVIAVPIGTLILVETEPKIMKLIISVVLLLTVGLLASGWRFKGDVGKGLMTLSGAVGGLIQGSAGMGGPPLVTALMSLPDNPTTTRANIVMALSTMSSLNLASLLFLGKITQNVCLILESAIYICMPTQYLPSTPTKYSSPQARG